MDPSRRMRLWRVLEKQGRQYLGRWDELKYLLAPYVARTAEEQRLFYQLFEQWQQECEAEAERLAEAPPPVEGEKRPGWRRWRWIPALLLVGLAAWRLWPPDNKVGPAPVQIGAADPQLREGTVLYLKNETILAGPADTSDFRWEVRDAESGEPEGERETFDLRWTLTGTRNRRVILSRPGADSALFRPLADTVFIEVLCANPPQMDSVRRQPNDERLVQNREYTFSVPPQEGVVAEWVFAGRDTLRGFEVRYAFPEAAADVRYRLRLYREGAYADCYSAVSGELPVRSDKPILATRELRPDRPRQLLSVGRWYWLPAFLPLLAGLFLLYRWQQSRRKKRDAKTAAGLEAEYPIHDRAPYFIPYLPQENKIQAPPDFFRIADVLRRREAGQRRVFDAPGAVQATVEAGGFPSWKDRPLTRPAEFLFLLQHRDEQHQQDKLFRRLVVFLQKRDAPLLAFFHRGDFGRVWNSQYPEGLTLEQLHRQYPNHRLVALGGAHGLVNPYASQKPALLAAPLLALRRWPRRLLLTPEPVADWSYQEALLYRHFRLYPANTAGMLAGVEALDLDEEYIPGSFGRWQEEMLPKHPGPGCRYRDWRSLEEHRRYLSGDSPLFRWLCALAVNAQPDWALTIAIGRALGIDVTHDRLLRLSRIPWLAGNQPDTRLRLDLLRQLSREDERLARQAVSEELELARERVEGGFAQADWTSSLAVQRFALDPHGEANKDAIRSLKKLGLISGDQLEELEFTLRERIGGANQKFYPAREGRTQNTPRLDAWLDAEEPRPVWTRTLLGAFLSLLAGLAALGWGAWYNSLEKEGQPAAFWQQARLLNDEALELHDRAVGIGQRQVERAAYAEWAAAADSVLLADTLLQQAIALRAAEGYPLADSNRIALAYNYGAQRFNFYLVGSTGWQEGQRARAAFEQAMGLLPDPLDPRALDVLHAIGLTEYYQAKEEKGVFDAARRTYAALLRLTDSAYFENLRPEMPVNLETLLRLERPLVYLNALFLDAETGSPLPGAALALPAGIQEAGKDGMLRYRFTAPPASENGRLRLRAQADGYRPQDYAFLLRGRPAGEDTVRLTPLPRISEWSGRVLNAATGAPVANADVQAGDANSITEDMLRAQGGPLSARSDAQGYFRLANISREAYQLQLFVRAEDYQDTLLRINLPEEDFLLRLEPKPAAPLSDRDQDGLPDAKDGCPDEPGPPAARGCPDKDGDTVPDKDDGCPEVAGRAEDKGCPPTGEGEVSRPSMVLVKGGTFEMGDTFDEGDDDEKPVHTVRVSDLFMGRYEVTNREFVPYLNAVAGEITLDENGDEVSLNGNGIFENFCGSEKGGCRGFTEMIEYSGGKKPGGRFSVVRGYEDHPVVLVSWYGAIGYCNWLSRRHGLTPVYTIRGKEISANWNADGYRLPTEAEWEYAARQGGQKVRFGNGRDTARASQINFNASEGYKESYSEVGEYRERTVSVGSLNSPNSLGLHDMSGNVWEWCWDWFGNYPSESQVNPKGPDTGSTRVDRGGSWRSSPRGCRAANRGSWNPAFRYNVVGFRLARSQR